MEAARSIGIGEEASKSAGVFHNTPHLLLFSTTQTFAFENDTSRSIVGSRHTAPHHLLSHHCYYLQSRRALCRRRDDHLGHVLVAVVVRLEYTYTETTLRRFHFASDFVRDYVQVGALQGDADTCTVPRVEDYASTPSSQPYFELVLADALP